MNKWIGMGRLVADPEVRYTQGEEPMAIARYRMAINRKFKREGEQEADFISIIAFGKAAEFVEKYFRKGMKVVVSGRIQTGSYTNSEGQKVYTTDIIAEEQEFAESKAAGQTTPAPQVDSDGFMNIPDGIDEELPFN